jgi:hypothetical protein
MINRRVMDIATILFVVLIIASVMFSNYLFTKSTQNLVGNNKDPEELLRDTVISFQIGSLLIYLVIFGYYILVLILAIQLYSKEKLSLVNLIFIGVFVPFAFFFYLLSLRKPLKEYEMN